MCTRILWNTNGHAVLAGRTMDWPESTEPVLTVFPRGLERNGGALGGTTVVGDNPLLWTSGFGSLVTTVYGAGTADGINEAGLAAHMLYLDSTDLGPRDPSRPGLQIALWIQYLLDCARTVQEALDLLDTCQLVPVEVRGFKASVHVALEDASGDSAIIEYIAGGRQVHHDRSYTIMTNEPSYEEQLRLLREKVRAVQGLGHDRPSSEVPLPGNVNAVDRFQRAAYFGSLLPEPADDRQAVAAILAVTRNASVPFGAPYREEVQDLQHRVPHRLRPHQQAVLLRAGDQPEPPVGRDRPLRPVTRGSRHDAAPRRDRPRRGRLGQVHASARAVLKGAMSIGPSPLHRTSSLTGVERTPTLRALSFVNS